MALAVPTVQVDNERVIVTAWRFAVGAETGPHRHEHDYVVVPLVDGHVRIVGPDGTTSEAFMARGGSYARPAGVEHNVINANPFEFEFVEIELR